MLLMLPLLTLLAFRFRGKIFPIFRDINLQNAAQRPHAGELAGIHVVKAFARRITSGRCSTTSRKLLELRLKDTATWAHYMPLLQMGTTCPPLVL